MGGMGDSEGAWVKHRKSVFGAVCRGCKAPMLEVEKEWLCPNDPKLSDVEQGAVQVLWFRLYKEEKVGL